ncbi:hypothetical protein TNCV_1607461 [Trichonephila clavipes]|nr:hypothetical protein TNCV_1607461 [Trichonephila clavipes]
MSHGQVTRTTPEADAKLLLQFSTNQAAFRKGMMFAPIKNKRIFREKNPLLERKTPQKVVEPTSSRFNPVQIFWPTPSPGYGRDAKLTFETCDPRRWLGKKTRSVSRQIASLEREFLELDWGN